MKILSVVLLIIAPALIGCGPSADDLVARVGTSSITSGALRTFVTELPEGMSVRETGDTARRVYLQDLIDRRLMLVEARSRGLDTTQAVHAAVGKEVARRARDRYRARTMVFADEVSDEEGRRYFATEGFDRERKLTAILVENRDQIEAALAALGTGEAFEDIARAQSADETAAAKGGELGWVGRDMAEQLYIPLEIFLQLPSGQVSAPLPAGKQWHVVRFTEERPASYEKYRLLVASRLRAERSAQRAEEHFEQLEASFAVQMKTDGLNELVAAYRQKTPAVLTASPTPLYAYDQGEIAVGQAQRILKSMNLYRGLVDSDRAATTLQKYVLRPFLLEEAARRAGIYDEPDIKRLAAELQENVLLDALRKDAITDKITLSEEEVRQYYDQHPEIFFHEGSIWIEELLLPTRAAAQDLREQLEAGARFAEFASLSLRPGAVERETKFHFHLQEKVLHPRLVPAVFQAEQDQLVGPLELKEGFSVFRIFKRNEGAVEAFVTAKLRARNLLIRQRQQDRFQSLMEILRERYADQVETFDARLQAALPDSLVGVE